MATSDLTRGGQFLVIGVHHLDAETREIIQKVQPGGFILFGRNIQNQEPEQLRAFIDELRSLVTKHEPVITIDQEGGRVSRLKVLQGGQEPPSARELREFGNVDLIAEHGRITGQLLRLFGFNLNLCPVLDVSYNGDLTNSVKDRTYGLTTEEVIRNARAFNTAMRKERIASCGKHFPGYSRAPVDSHEELPVIELRRDELETFEWVPYVEMLSELDSVMIGHVRNSHLDPSGKPSSLSKAIVDGFLRNELGFKRGMIITDDLDMGAIVNEYGLNEAMRLAIQAGNDLILHCHRTAMAVEAAEALSQLSDETIAPAVARLGEFRSRLAKPSTFDKGAFETLNTDIYRLREAVLGAEAAKTRSIEDGKRSPVEFVGETKHADTRIVPEYQTGKGSAPVG